ncbi:LacI family transcriptional regulator [Eubacteriales bacterium OttesenSCG-928-N13]|nr:LacI family transcriptional regulator [Eubacteriales bacterium OttesenSCG-928-N13]
MRIATLKDIASRAGVSITTVSNVVNGNYNRVSPSNVKRIQALIEECHYVPNQSARSLTNKSTNMIGIIIQSEYMTNSLTDSYVGEFVGSVVLHLQRLGYDSLIRMTNDYVDINRSLRKWNLAGAIFTGTYDRYIRDLAEDTRIPFIFTDSYSSSRRINNVGVDDFRGGVLAAEHLLKMGHRRIAFIAPGLHKSEVDEQRKNGFLSALGRFGLKENGDYLMPTSDSGMEMAEMLMDMSPPVTAAFVTADRAAIRLIDALKELGKRVPDDYSIVGFDNIELGQYATPPLTTVAQAIQRKAKVAVDILVRHIENPYAPPENILIDVSLLERGSVRRL